MSHRDEFRARVKGTVVPMPTPFNDDLSVDSGGCAHLHQLFDRERGPDHLAFGYDGRVLYHDARRAPGSDESCR